MAITLTIADNADGTGGVATIAGSPSGSTNTLYAAAFAGATGAISWAAQGTRTGDGTLPVAPGNGFWLWYVDSLSGGSHSLSAIVAQNLTNAGAQSVHYRCLLAVQTLVQALQLVSPSQVQVRMIPRFWEGVESLPLIAVVPLGRESQVGELTGKDDIVYPVVVAILDRQNQDYQANLARNLSWRQSIFRGFRHSKLAGVPEVITADVAPDWIANPDLFAKNLWYSAFLINFRSREVRGFGQ